jgi:hypothetical protein
MFAKEKEPRRNKGSMLTLLLAVFLALIIIVIFIRYMYRTRREKKLSTVK